MITLDCYLHWYTLVIRAGDGTVHLLLRKEEVNQGEPLAMVEYGMGILLLIRKLQQSHPGINHPWYADDSGASGTFEGIRHHLDDLMVRGPPQGLFLEPTKSILVVSSWNFPRAEAFFRSYGLQIVTGSLYLGGFWGTKEAQEHYLGEKVEGWQYSVATLAVVACRHPQTAYASL